MHCVLNWIWHSSHSLWSHISCCLGYASHAIAQSIPCCCPQVALQESERFRSAARVAASSTAASAADRAYQQLLMDPGSRPTGVHPMLRNVAEAMPSDFGFRTGRPPPVEQDQETRRFRAQVGWVLGFRVHCQGL